MLRNERSPALLAAVAFVGIGMAYTLLWSPVVRHVGGWLTPGDFWSTYRTSSFVAWGAAGQIYQVGTGLIALPGFPVLLTPVVIVSSWAHLSSAFPLPLPYPSAWLVAGPFVLACGAAPVLAVDSLSRCLWFGARKRGLVVVATAVLCWPAVAMWGHPEDTLAVALWAWSLGAAWRHQFVLAAWLVGFAFAVQPLVILALPVLAAYVIREVGWRRGAALAFRAAVVPVSLVFIAFHGDPSGTVHALFDQPNWPQIDWPTPWVHLAPHLTSGGVAAGPGRLIAVGLGLSLGAWVFRSGRNPGDLASLMLWASGLAMAGRCVFEAVMVPYYVMPGAVVLVLAVARSRSRALPTAVATALFLTVYTNWRWDYWPWYVEMVLLFGVLAWLARPSLSRLSASPRAAPPPELRQETPKQVGQIAPPLVGVGR